jgi:CO/xanthine dehydrogenase Mo-binding subunit
MNNTSEKIGKTIPRFDAVTKVTGRERYAADYYGEDFLWTGVKRAGIPHALLKAIHTGKVRDIPGVAAVLTHEDVKGTNRYGIIRKDEPVLADKKIHHCGDAVALVLAEDREALRRAIENISFDYEPLPGVFDPEEALKEGAIPVHEDNSEGNVIRYVPVETGNPGSAFNECDTVVEAVFEVPRQEHAYLETEAGWAYFDKDGQLVIIVATQTPFRDRFEIAPALGLDMEKIHLIVPYLGGAFGGKDGITVQCLLGLAALHSGGRSVKMWWDRQESFLASVKRLPARMYYRLGAKGDGTLHALECRLYFDGGAYASLGGEIMTLAAEHAGSAYRIPHVSIKGWCVYTNNPVGGPFRGFGVPQVTAAMEQMMDILALKIKMDPLEIRKKNTVRRGDKNCLGVTLTHSTGAGECLKVLSEHPLWKEKDTWKALAGPFKARGVGIACMAHAMGYPPMVPDVANAKIEITEEGKIRVYAGVVDMGQGNASTYLQIAGEILSQGVTDMELVLPDTERTLPSGSSSASRTTYTYGNALIKAAAALKSRMLEKASSLIPGSGAEECILAEGRVIHKPTGKEIPFHDLALFFDESERVCTDTFTMPVVEGMNDVIYMGPHIIYSYGAHLVYIEIDMLTGKAEIKQYLAVTDAGKVINPQAYEQQIQGAIAQGIGYALHEDYKVEGGVSRTPDLASYIIPTSMDTPEIISIPIEMGEESGPFGMKGVGEIAMSGPMPAIANAICDACGIRISRSPYTAEKILSALSYNERPESCDEG